MTALAAKSISNGDLALDLRHVAKTYRGAWGRGGVQALRGITMQVQRGGVFGLLGPNGAGKSTLVKILMTVIRPTRCEGTLLGAPVGDKATLGRIGYLPEHHRFPDYLTGAQVLDYFGALANVRRADRKKRSAELLELVGLTAWADKRVKGYSEGMRQRLGIANALMNDPDLVVLDEPTDGVDPVGRRDIRNVLLRLKDEGKTVFVNSHLLSELEMISDRVAILVQGIVSAQGTIEELTKESRRYEIEVMPEPGQDNANSLPETLSNMVRLLPAPPSHPATAGAPMSTDISMSGTLVCSSSTEPIPVSIERSLIRVKSEDPLIIQPFIDLLRNRGFTIKAVRPVRASLEDLFMQAVTDPTTGEVLAPGAAATPKGNGRTTAGRLRA